MAAKKDKKPSPDRVIAAARALVAAYAGTHGSSVSLGEQIAARDEAEAALAEYDGS